MGDHIFRGRVAITEWVDGDTFRGVLDQGRGMFHGGGLDLQPYLLASDQLQTLHYAVVVTPLRHRCALIQAPELEKELVSNPAGQPLPGRLALLRAVELAPPAVYDCFTFKSDDNFDRPLVDLILRDGTRFSDAMLKAGHAKPFRR